MRKYVFQRFLQLIPILVGITFLTFGMMQFAADDAVDVMFEQSGGVTEEVKAAKRAELGLDQAFLVQYGHWLQGVVTGDMGRSYISGKLVFDTFMDKMPATVELMLASVGLTLLFAIPLGIYAAVRQNRWPDYIIRFLTFVGNSLPNFFVGLLLIYFLALQAGLFPVMSSADNPLSVVLPAVTLAIAMGAKYTRQIRAVVLEELAKPYVAGALDPLARCAEIVVYHDYHAARALRRLAARRHGHRGEYLYVGRRGQDGRRCHPYARLPTHPVLRGLDVVHLCQCQSGGGSALPLFRSTHPLWERG